MVGGILDLNGKKGEVLTRKYIDEIMKMDDSTLLDLYEKFDGNL